MKALPNFMRGRIQAAWAWLLCLFLSLSMILAVQAAGQDSPTDDVFGPTIVDTTSGNPVTGRDFSISVTVTDPSGVDISRLNYYFMTSSVGLTTPINEIMARSGTSFQHTFSVPNDAFALYYTILASDSLGNWESLGQFTVDVEDGQSPVAACDATISINSGEYALFDASASTDNVGVSNYTWSFTYDGATTRLYGVTPEFRFHVPGQYSGALAVKDSWGNSGTATFTVNVADIEPPTANAGIAIFVVSGELATLDGAGSSDNSGMMNYTWTYIQNGTAWTLYGETVSIRFWKPGQYNVTLTVSDAAGNTDSAVVPVQVLSSPSEGSISWGIYLLIAIIMIIIIATIVVIRM